MSRFPANSVVVKVPRKLFPNPFNQSGYYYQELPYIGREEYNLVIIPTGEVRSRMGATNLQTYGFLYSGKSGKCYRWVDYYAHEYSKRSTEVGGEKVFVECVPPRDHNNPPSMVNVYASTAGVVWLAARAVCNFLLRDVFLRDIEPLTNLEDAPFSTYLDRLAEIDALDEYTVEFRTEFRERLELFFGTNLTEKKS